MGSQAQHAFKELSFVPPITEKESDVLTDDALAFIHQLATRFAHRVPELLAAREARQAKFDAGALPDFLSETADIREGDWTIRGIPADLQDRRLEITGPPERKMVINA